METLSVLPPLAIDFWIRLILNLVTLFILIWYIYYPNNGQKELIFTFIIIGIVAFFIASVLNRVKIDFAMAIGMFAVFSIIRYRTPPFEVKEMSYLFAVIGISVINALVESKNIEWLAIVVADIILLVATLALEKYSPRNKIEKKPLTITLTDIGIITDKLRLTEEVKKQTNLNVFKVEVSKINAIKKEVTVWVYFR
jgi:FtsH-binding integral membrane protein